MSPDAVDGQSVATALDACGEPSRFPPTTPSSELTGLGAAGKSGDDDLESSSSFWDQQQDGESDTQQLAKEVCQLKNSTEELLSLSSELDRRSLDLSHELHQLHSVIDEKRCRIAVQKLVELLEKLKGLERQESGLESKLLICEEEISNLSRSKCGSIDLDSHLINSTNKLNSLKRELATKMRANFSLRCRLDDVPVQTELIQYERRFSELYAQIQEKHHLTRRHYATYNALLEIKEIMLKEASLLNSINSQFKDAMTTPSGRSKLLDSMEVIVKGTKHKLEKAKLDLFAEQKVYDSLKEKFTVTLAEQRHFSFLLKTFQDACTKYERHRQLAST